MKTKAELRQHFRSLFKGAGASADPSNTTANPNVALNERLVAFLQPQSGAWAAFQPTGFEPDIRPTITGLSQIDWVYPRVEGETMTFYRPHKDASMTLNRWGILEPDPGRADQVDLSNIKGLLVPGVAFDTSCNRLGRGGGFYDRALADMKEAHSSAIKIGVALDRQIADEPLPVEPFDVPMDWVVTESRSIRREGAERKSS